MKWYVGFHQKKDVVECPTLEQAILFREKWVSAQVAEKFEPTLLAMRKRYGLPFDTPAEVMVIIENIRDNTLKNSVVFCEEDFVDIVERETLRRAVPVSDMIVPCITDSCV